jgi:hypothetical protein
MKRNLTVLLSTGALVGALSAGFTFARAQSTNPATPHASAEGSLKRAVQRHPAVFKAIQALRDARKDIEYPGHDFGGQKKVTLEACDKAIAQLELALKSDKE